MIDRTDVLIATGAIGLWTWAIYTKPQTIIPHIFQLSAILIINEMSAPTSIRVLNAAKAEFRFLSERALYIAIPITIGLIATLISLPFTQ